METLEYELLKWNKDGREELFRMLENGCGVETIDGKHYVVSNLLRLKQYELSERMYNELIERRILEVIGK